MWNTEIAASLEGKNGGDESGRPDEARRFSEGR